MTIDTSDYDTKPKWGFVGLEDARLVHWNDRFFMCGGRRDVKSNGEGRVELSELLIDDSYQRN